MGEDFIEVKHLAKSLFKNVHFFKPESSQKRVQKGNLFTLRNFKDFINLKYCI